MAIIEISMIAMPLSTRLLRCPLFLFYCQRVQQNCPLSASSCDHPRPAQPPQVGQGEDDGEVLLGRPGGHVQGGQVTVPELSQAPARLFATSPICALIFACKCIASHYHRWRGWIYFIPQLLCRDQESNSCQLIDSYEEFSLLAHHNLFTHLCCSAEN